jgi:type III pantothenate kinase
MIPGMLLAIDIGNTNITIGTYRSGVLLGSRRAATQPEATVDQLEVTFEGLLRLDGLGISDITALAVSSVVPALTDRLEQLAERRGQPILVATSGTVPIPIRVERPADVGPDRLVNAFAAGRLHGTPAIVVDLGTAATFDAVGPDGAFLGGAIAPGPAVGLDTLAARTARLPRVELRVPDRAIGRDTVSAIQAGSVLGYQALAGGLIARQRRELAELAHSPTETIRVILTGGLSRGSWAGGIDGVDVVDPDLTLNGLAVLHQEVAGGEPLALGLE